MVPGQENGYVGLQLGGSKELEILYSYRLFALANAGSYDIDAVNIGSESLNRR